MKETKWPNNSSTIQLNKAVVSWVRIITDITSNIYNCSRRNCSCNINSNSVVLLYCISTYVTSYAASKRNRKVAKLRRAVKLFKGSKLRAHNERGDVYLASCHRFKDTGRIRRSCLKLTASLVASDNVRIPRLIARKCAPLYPYVYKKKLRMMKRGGKIIILRRH